MALSEKNLFINANGIEISYVDIGNGNIPIIFIHGFPFNKSSWMPQIDFLKSSHRVIAYDIRGYGDSDRGKAEPSINLFADDLISFMDALKIKKAIVCGLSMGGYILLNAVKRHSERFHAIILSDTQCIADSDEAKAKRYSTIKLIEDGGINEFTDGFLKNIFSLDTLQNNLMLVEKIKAIMLSVPSEIIIGTLKALAGREEACSTLSKINIPTMILCGKEDKPTPVIQSENMNRSIPGSILHIIDNAGHMSNLEQSEIFNNFLENFLKKII